MNKARSIKQKAYPDSLPNFRNLGVTLRILLLSNALALLKAFVDADDGWDVLFRMMQIATLLSPVLFVSLLALWLAQPWLKRLEYWRGVMVVNGLVVAITLVVYYVGGSLYQPFAIADNYFDWFQYALISVIVCWTLLMYFRLRSQVLSRALHDARLQVLRARIRPHFLFNTINAVLSIVRAQPKQAEKALEDMSDLFRMAMAETHDLVSLSQEIKLGKQYLALEQLRMGERLGVDWEFNDAPMNALIPPLLLQPLLENAVYHGIEPLPHGGRIKIQVNCRGQELRLVVENPCATLVAERHSGNKMALQNIRERLELLFDAEARYQVEANGGFYRVEITLPCVTRETL
ncbi:MAG: sensor histidine kinase [Gallionella sp.]|jgi:two-component system sensor histidine kinase AlgZ|nr:sensor histidine kinase [Gallionella sp.]